MKQITLIRPDDWHCHLRDGEFLSRTVPDTATQFARAIVMPNLSPPVTTVAQAREYQQRILAHTPAGAAFTPLMTLYLTEELTADTLREAKTSGVITGCKLYPYGATTHSTKGITHLAHIYPLLECLQEIDMPLLIHGESIEPGVDIFDREEQFIDRELTPLLRRFPALRIVLEHISTRTAVDFVRANHPALLAATITAHHLWYNRDILLSGGIRPHYYCMPILKRRSDQEALLEAATSGDSQFFLGTDSAPHLRSRKESACGCAGIYTAFSAIELYAQLFESVNALAQLENFASVYGPQFYRLPVNQSHITLEKSPWRIPEELSFGDGALVPLLAGEMLDWKITTTGVSACPR
jgi:dihydroorotase